MTSGPNEPPRAAADGEAAPRISLVDAVDVVRTTRRDDDVVITSMGVAREWMTRSQHALDLVHVPSAMGHATSVGLGLAIARPDVRVIVCHGDGSMLMNLGSLVSITAAGPANLTVILFDNRVYEVTGAQPTPGSPPARADGGSVDFAAMAHACGFLSVHRFSELTAWRRSMPALLDAPGPRFVVLDIAPVPGALGPRSPGPGHERARRFMEALESVRVP